MGDEKVDFTAKERKVAVRSKSRQLHSLGMNNLGLIGRAVDTAHRLYWKFCMGYTGVSNKSLRAMAMVWTSPF
jgi:hypothetical protein